ncbi:MAG: PAS domain-containing protein, partial [Candidatus Thiodiazotropha sp.]
MRNSRFLRLYLFTLLLLTLASVLFFRLMERPLKADLDTELKLESNNLINLLHKQMSLAFVDIQSDLRFLADQKSLHLLDNLQERQQRIDALERLWIGFARQRKRYDQIRFIDNKGNEIIRVNYNDGNPEAVAENRLQSKRQRYYFTEAIVLPPGKIYVSPLDLNVENKAIELPLKPMIRFAVPIADDDGKVMGVIVLNYLAGKLLEDFRRTATGFNGLALLVNAGGYPLSSPESSQDWNFMFPDNPQTGIHTSHPLIWQHMKQDYRGQSITAQGIFTYDTINPAGQSPDPTCASCLFILLHVPADLIDNKLSRRHQEMLKFLLFSVSVIALILGALIWHRDKRHSQAREIATLNEQIANERNLFVSGPGIIAKLRNELGWPVEYISANIQELTGYPAEAFQNGDLSYSSIIESAYLQPYAAESEAAGKESRESFKRAPYRIIDRQGRAKWVQDISRVIRDAHGKVTHYYAHISDITALKDAEQQLSISHQHIQKVVDTIPDPTLVIDVSNYQLQLANQAARKLYSGGQAFSQGMTCYRLSHKRDDPCTGLSDPCPIQEVLMTG